MAQWTSQKEVNGYKKVQELRMDTSPGFATQPVVWLETFQKLSTILSPAPSLFEPRWLQHLLVSLPLLEPLPFFFD